MSWWCFLIPNDMKLTLQSRDERKSGGVGQMVRDEQNLPLTRHFS